MLLSKKVSVEEALKQPERWIPDGIYCYDSTGYLCPFWHKDITKPHQENGYCHYLKMGDWESEYISLLWDMCKECDINDDDWDDEDE